MPLLQNVGVQTLSGGLIALLVSVLSGESIVPPSEWPWQATLAVLYLGVVGTVFGYSAYSFVLGRTAPEIAGTYALMNPIVAMVLGAIFLGESLSTRNLIAAALVLTGVGLILFEKRLRPALSGGLRVQHATSRS